LVHSNRSEWKEFGISGTEEVFSEKEVALENAFRGIAVME